MFGESNYHLKNFRSSFFIILGAIKKVDKNFLVVKNR